MAIHPGFSAFKQQVAHPVKYRLFLLSKLPLAFITGLRIQNLQEDQAAIRIRFKWINQNPFRSIYFAALSMAAELSTGILAFAQLYQRKPGVSMLVVSMEGAFYKKAVGTIVFTCTDGMAIANAIEQTIATGEGITLPCTTIGLNEAGEEVAKFVFVWSFKAKAVSYQ